ncbi:MAG: DNA-3-methyladenine glycosylase [Anaerolineales bacterium]|nr:DNA-3-methyladenine glycosylase [Anaerolineales bacterium]
MISPPCQPFSPDPILDTASRLPRSFYNRPTPVVAQELLGTRLVHMEQGVRLSGWICETEAYCGEEDLACHAKAGRTPRTAVMYGPPGVAYVYFTYGMHWLFNIVTRPAGLPEAVLVRAIVPAEGLEIIAQRRGSQPRKRWADGPAKLTQSLGIDRRHNNLDLCASDAEIFIAAGISVPDEWVTIGPRVGLGTTPEPWLSKPWRFFIEDAEARLGGQTG